MRRALVFIAFLAAACMPIACGAGDAASDALTPEDVAAAAERTADFDTYRASFKNSISARGETVVQTGEGEFASKGRRASLTMTSSVEGTDVDMDMVMAWPIVYMRVASGGVRNELPAGKEWIKLDMQKVGKKLGFDLNELMQANQSDPTQGLAYLQEVTDLETLGAEDVRGIETTHFGGVIDLHRVAEEMPEVKESVERIIELSKVERVPYEAWVSADGLIRRIKLSYENMRNPGAPPMDMTVEMELFDFGADVTVEEPPADAVITLEALLRHGEAA
jgi:hypothetical protein